MKIAAGIGVKTLREMLVFQSLLRRKEQLVNIFKVLLKLMILKFQLLLLNKVRIFKMHMVPVHIEMWSYHKVMTSLHKIEGI